MSTERQSTKPENSQKQQQINWNDFNYPPLLRLMHFKPSELPKGKKALVMLAFAIHITIILNTILNIINDCIQGGIDILYAFLFFFIFNPLILFLFYRCYIGLCKDKSKLSLFIYIQPLAIIIEIIVSIANFLGFNGFVKVSTLYKQGYGFQGTLGVITSVTYMVVALLSCYMYFLVFKKRSLLAKAFI